VIRGADPWDRETPSPAGFALQEHGAVLVKRGANALGTNQMNQHADEKARTPRNLIAARVPADLVSPFHRFNTAEKEALRALGGSDDPADQRRALAYLRTAPDYNRAFIMETADVLIPRRSQHVRWGTLLLVGDFCEAHPDEVWPLVVRWGSVESKDIRIGIACCVLEHLLEHHFQAYFPKAQQILASGNRRFRLTLQTCWRLGQAEEPANQAAIGDLMAPLAGRPLSADEQA